jgi:hypothetical protein
MIKHLPEWLDIYRNGQIPTEMIKHLPEWFKYLPEWINTYRNDIPAWWLNAYRKAIRATFDV